MMLKIQRRLVRPHVLIIGAGALGKALAALLAEQAMVSIYDRNRVIRRSLNKGYFVFKEKGCSRRVKIRSVMTFSQLQGEKIDLLIIATKAMDLQGAVRQAKALSPQYVFLPQNGLFEINGTKRIFKLAKICRGVTTMACQATGADHVSLHYRGDIYVGGDGAKKIARLFRQCGIRARAFGDPKGLIWAKLIFSAVMNPLPVFTGEGYEVLKKDHKIWRLVLEAVHEGRRVAKAQQVRLAFDPLRLIQRVRDGDLAGISHRGTLYQDISAGRKTELGFITGALIRRARKAGVKTPALRALLDGAQKAGA